MAKRSRPPKQIDDENTSLSTRDGDYTEISKDDWGEKNLKAGDNTKYLTHALNHMKDRPVDLNNDDEVEETIMNYFKQCRDDDMKPTVNGMANSLGITKGTLQSWLNGKSRTAGRQDIVTRAYSLLAELWEDYMMNGKINPASGIFLGKNHFGYTDVQEVQIAPKDNSEQEEATEAIRKKYLDNVVIIDVDTTPETSATDTSTDTDK